MANNKATIAGINTGISAEDGVFLASGALTVTDPDAGQSFLRVVSGASAKYGTWSIDANGIWSYLLNNSSDAVQSLGAGKTLTDTFTVTSLDGSASKIVTVTIQGTNDVPVITGQTTGSISEDATARATGTLIVTDRDAGQSFTTVATNVVAAHGTWSVDGSGHWSYKVNNADSAVQGLIAGQTLTDSFTVYSKDGTASQIVTVTINGTNDVPTITGDVTGNVVENGTLTATGTLTVNDKDAGQSNSIMFGGLAKYGTWSVDADGHWSYQLDNSNAKVQALGAGKTLTDTFFVLSEDGLANKTVKITITGSNDIPTITGKTTGEVTDGATLTATGTLSVSDIDAGQSSAKAASNVASTYGHWSVTSTGNWSYQLDSVNPAVKSLLIGQTLTDTFEVQSSDGSGSKLVTITIAGDNHAATISGAAFGQVIEDNQLSANGTLVVSDQDAGEAHTQAVSNAASAYGHWSVDDEGHWSYELDDSLESVQALSAGQSMTDSFIVSSFDGTAFETVTINIGGINDAPAAPVDTNDAENVVRAGAAAGTSVGITVHATDIDGPFLSYALTDNAGGRFQIDGQTGAITVAAGAVLSEGTYTVSATAWDGQASSAPQDYIITVEGPNHAPVLAQTAISVAFTAATAEGWAVWVGQQGGQPVPVATFGSFPQYTLQVGSKLYFTGSDAQHGDELWSYDVATGTTSRVADIWVGTNSSNTAYLTELGGKLYFSASDGVHGTELWMFDPVTETASLAADILPGSDSASLQSLTVLGDKLYFTTQGELWVFDPAANAASLAAEIRPGANGSWPALLTALGGKLFFVADDGVHGSELWIYDPASGTASYKDIVAGSGTSFPNNFEVLDGKLYFNANDASHGSEVFVYDPATDVVSVAVDMTPGTGGTYPSQLTALDGKLYYVAYVSGNYQLLVYDPVTHQSQIATDQPLGFSPAFIKAVGGQLYFSGDDGINGRELWVFNPATGHASLYADLYPGSHAQVTNQGVEVAGKVYFHASDDAHGNELWVYDPATNTAQLAVDVWPGPNGTYPNSQVALDGKLYFAGNDGTNGTELWVYDPVTDSAAIAADVLLGGSSNPQFLTVVDGKLYFSADDGSHGAELWIYDPASGTAALAADILPGSMGASLQSLTAMDGKLYFNADDGVHGGQLWVYDPADQTTVMLTDMGRTFWPMGSQPSDLTVLGGKLYFNADDAINGRELWVYDPATGAATLAADILPGPYDGNPQDLVILDGKLYFRAYNDLIGAELWTYDPATGTASLVQDISEGPFGSSPTELTVLDGKLYFVASDIAHGNELRVYDPTTNTVSLAAELIPGTGNANPRFLTVTDGKLFFVASDGTSAGQLWVYDPATQTTTIANVVGGPPNSSNPQQIIEVISDGMQLASISENPTSNLGSSVAAILGQHATDQDGDIYGVAITAADTAHGDWQYSLDHGVSWAALGAVSDQAATLLADTALIRFVPNADWTGTAEITVRAWDQTDGHQSGDSGVDVSINGNQSAYSSAALQASIEVDPTTLVNGDGTSETLGGTNGANVIDAGHGDDILIGGGGGDTLIGGGGADHFKYLSATDSTLSHLDIIGDFNAADGDSIDFSTLGIAAGVVDGGLVASFGATPGSVFGANGLIIETDGANTRVYADSDHSGTFNANTDVVVQLSGNHLNALLTQPDAIVIA